MVHTGTLPTSWQSNHRFLLWSSGAEPISIMPTGLDARALGSDPVMHRLLGLLVEEVGLAIPNTFRCGSPVATLHRDNRCTPWQAPVQAADALLKGAGQSQLPTPHWHPVDTQGPCPVTHSHAAGLC